MIKELEPFCYRAGIKPKEFKDCTFKELTLFVQSFFKEKENDFKTKVVLCENITDKMLYNNPNNVKHPQKIKLREIYKELFKEDVKKMQELGIMKPQNEEEQYQFVKELSEELKKERGDDK